MDASEKVEVEKEMEEEEKKGEEEKEAREEEEEGRQSMTMVDKEVTPTPKMMKVCCRPHTRTPTPQSGTRTLLRPQDAERATPSGLIRACVSVNFC